MVSTQGAIREFAECFSMARSPTCCLLADPDKGEAIAAAYIFSELMSVEFARTKNNWKGRCTREDYYVPVVFRFQGVIDLRFCTMFGRFFPEE